LSATIEGSLKSVTHPTAVVMTRDSTEPVFLSACHINSSSR